MTDQNALSLASDLAAQLNAAGADYSAKAAVGTAAALLIPKSDAAKAVGLIVRAAESDTQADAAATALAEKLKSSVKGRTGVLSVLALKAPRAAQAAELAAGVEKIMTALDSVKPAADGLKVVDAPAPGTGFEYASWSPQAAGLTVELLFRIAPDKAEVKTAGAATHWLALTLPDDKRPLVRAIAVKIPAADVVRRLWWAFPKGSGWTFLPF
jgi:hypothetical protein